MPTQCQSCVVAEFFVPCEVEKYLSLGEISCILSPVGRSGAGNPQATLALISPFIEALDHKFPKAFHNARHATTSLYIFDSLLLKIFTHL